MLATSLGVLLALVLLLVGYAVMRMLRAFAGLLRTLGRPRAGWRLRGLRLSRSRALAQAEGARATAMEAEVRRLRAELRLMRAERDRALSGNWERPARGTAPDDRFARAKREFAMRFHPDRLRSPALERSLRGAIFREYWGVLRRIERGG